MSGSAATISSSSSVIDKTEFSDKHFRWDSIRKFLFLTNAYSHGIYNFDLFSKIFYKVSIVHFVICQLCIGMPYMFMDGFIKQYTRRIDGQKFLNPLLKGISFGLFLQTGFWALLQSLYLADSVRFFVTTLRRDLPWSYCYGEGKNSTCTSLDGIVNDCFYKGTHVIMEDTAAHHHYVKTFHVLERSVLTNRFFSLGLVWLLNFFVSTVTDATIVKIFYFGFIFKGVSTTVVVIVLLVILDWEPKTVLIEMMNYNTSSALIYSVQHMTFVYGVGYLGFHDCGAMSPYTMIDTAVVIFSVLFTVSALVRSWILRLIFLKLLDCVEVSQVLLHTHYFYFAIIPLSTEFLTANKLYVIYVYLNIILTTSGCLNMLTLTMAKLLHSEFRSVNTVYFVGLICCCGFGLSLPATVQLTSSSLILSGLNMGVNLIVPYLGALKVATIMWLYGVKRFSTDIQFWLGFNPTRYWKISWSVLPLVLLIQLIYTAIDYYNKPSSYFYEKLCALTWTAFSVLIVAIIQIVTLSKYMVGNKLASLFAANIKYGPPDPEDRKNRRNYSETIQLRRCKHSCQRLDDIIDCNDMPLMTSGLETTSSSASLTQDIYRAESLVLARGTSIRNPSLADLSRHQQ